MGSAELNRKLEERTLAFAVSVVRFVAEVNKSEVATVIVRQLVRSGTAIGANYREANRAESRDDFIHKTAIALKEAAETEYWLELCSHTGLGDPERLATLRQESTELLAIFTTITHRAKRR
jgi:four helix bundle protein